MLITIEDIKEYWLEVVLFIIMIYVLYNSGSFDGSTYEKMGFSCLPNPFRG